MLFAVACAPSIGPVLHQRGDAAVLDAARDAGAPGFRPEPGTSWQFQLTGPIDRTVDVEAYVIDLFDAGDDDLTALHADGRAVICWLSVGTYEPWRPDAEAIPEELRGSPLGTRGERFTDVRDTRVRALVAARLDLAVSRGCDAVAPANVDAFENDSGFAITADDQLAFNRWVASEAHARSLSVGLVNDTTQVDALVSEFDWALVQQCFQFDECALLRPFIEARRAVFHVEYELDASEFCDAANALDFDSLQKNASLDAFRVACR